jgi:N-formylglutamate deformylase
MSNSGQNEWVIVRRPAAPGPPLVFDSPHSGLTFPGDFRPAAPFAAIRTTWDAYVDELLAGVTGVGATLVAANFPRAYIDANRAADDIDPTLLDAPWEGGTRQSEHAARGMGLIRRLALPGVPMYDRLLTVAEVRGRLDACYLPYRRALREEIEAVAERSGRAWHFNCHSMKSRGNAMNRDAGVRRPDFVVGDRGGTTAHPRFTAWVADWFRAQRFQVAINEPYQGADIVRAHGHPARGRFSVQIEINRALYLDEATCERSARFPEIRDLLTAFAGAAAELLRSRPDEFSMR